MTSAPSGDVQLADLAGHRDFAAQWQQSISTLLDWAGAGPPAGGGVAVRRGPRAIASPAPARCWPSSPIRRGRRRSRRSIRPRARSGSCRRDRRSPAGDGPATPQHLREALRQDDAFWAAHLEALQARFDGLGSAGRPAPSPAPDGLGHGAGSHPDRTAAGAARHARGGRAGRLRAGAAAGSARLEAVRLALVAVVIPAAAVAVWPAQLPRGAVAAIVARGRPHDRARLAAACT